MDPRFSEMPNIVNGFNFGDEKSLPSYDQFQNNANGLKHNYLDLDAFDIPFLPSSPSPDNLAPSSTVSYESQSSPDDQESDPVLKFLNQILLEENMEDNPSMFHDPLALRATEKSLYEVIGQKYPSSPSHLVDHVDHHLVSPLSSNGGSSSIDSQLIVDPGEHNLHDFSSSTESLFGTTITQTNPFDNASLLQNIFTDSESISQFKRGMEEARRFLPTTNPLLIDLDKYDLPQKSEDEIVKLVKDDVDDSPNSSKGRKHHHPDDRDSERSSKQSAISVEDIDLSEMFERVLLCDDGKKVVTPRARANNYNESRGDPVDLRTLLISCAQSVAGDDRQTACEQLKQISVHSSPTSGAYQRLAHVFATGLQVRLGGIGAELYTPLTRRNITAAEILKAYQVYLSVCPFMKMSIFFANSMIASVASEATTLHIVDFGICYGLQWPVLIQLLSQRAGGPPKLRITGIELPQPGFRPAERVEETGCRLAKHCKRFGVPFEYQVIATQNWETVKIEDLKIVRGETLAVNCLFRFGRLLDETVVGDDSPRDAVLRLIRKLNPAIFVNAVTTGSYSAPFFVTRFREALFHYSALFDMLDATLPRECPQRMYFEQDFYGHEVINVITCEGTERVERPETYKQWQFRHMRAGFKPLPLDHELIKKLRRKTVAGYHSDFLFDEDGNWMIQGWKGRIICASCCWVPS
ncbi:hypothetical protein CASFOL_002839 [Castilleja foliolosa]|uniref:Uncharacterized protein n=1 Tax=Castilleja foliolosa TaxID=1961234 RepID=A0ABD3EFF7_9LAMI